MISYKKIVSLFFVCCFYFNAHGINVTVGSIYPGERLWDMTSRIGMATNVIESKVCGLDFDETETVNLPECDFVINQGDIPYIITMPGNYCVNENISFSGGTDAITIAADDVLLDLKGHTIDGSGQTGASAVLFNPAIRNITVRNGVIKDVGAFGVFGSTGHENIVFDNLDIIRPLLFGIAVGPGSVSVVIEDCRITAPDLGANGILLSGVSDGHINKCSLQSISATALIIDSSARHSISHCVFDAGTHGVEIADSVELFFNHCVSKNMSLGGFVCAATNAIDSSCLIFDNCVAQQCDFGFFFDASGMTRGINHIVVRDCVAQSCDTDGFSFISLAGGDIQRVMIERCAAIENDRDGFHIERTPAGTVHDFMIKNCQSLDNSSYGFYVSTPGLVSLLESTAQSNGINGIELTALTTGCKIMDCCSVTNGTIGINNLGGDPNAIIGNAAFDNTTDITGVSDGTFIVSRGLPGALAGSSRWTNAVS